MIFPLSYYLLSIPYSIIWHIKSLLRKEKLIVFYCDYALDYVIFENIRPYLPPIKIVAKNKKVQAELKKYGTDSILWPVFPDAVIMARHALHRFPCNRILRLGMTHGAYQFKYFINAKKYNVFDLFLFTSKHHLKQAENHGITCGQCGGFPKLDSLWFNDTEDKLKVLKRKLNFNNGKPNILFAATWENSGMSALGRWYDKLAEFTDDYNVMVTLHPFTGKKYRDIIKNTPGIHFIEDAKNYLYLKLADLMICDTSSIIAEFCSLDKPMVSFTVRESKRLTPEIIKLIKEVTYQIEDYNQLNQAIKHALKNPFEKSYQRQKYNNLMFDGFDKRHGEIAASKINVFLDEMSR